MPQIGCRENTMLRTDFVALITADLYSFILFNSAECVRMDLYVFADVCIRLI